ncbi:hypothetical protein T439DRAFT_329432 [Meredithblackwellia eburnea MCA 4105]
MSTIPSSPSAQAPAPVDGDDAERALGRPSAALGALGIPLPTPSEFAREDDEEGRLSGGYGSGSGPRGGAGGDSASTEANHPASPGPGSKGKGKGKEREQREQSKGSWIDEGGFRDIVDDLTIQNQQLRERLRKYESARIPSDLKKERLFEVRFFDGLPKAKRQELESFLTSYVQQISNGGADTPNQPGGSHHHRPRPPINPLIHHERRAAHSPDGDQGTATTSSIGVTLRSLRTSEKDRLAFQNGAGVTEYETGQSQSNSPGSDNHTRSSGAASNGAASGGGSTGRRIVSKRRDRSSLYPHQSVSGSGTGSGSAGATGNRENIATRISRYAQSNSNSHVSYSVNGAPLGSSPPLATASTSAAQLFPSNHPPHMHESHPPPILRRLPPQFALERDLLASPSYSGVEPYSKTGTGTGMKVTVPRQKKKLAQPSTSSFVPHKLRSQLPAKDTERPVQEDDLLIASGSSDRYHHSSGSDREKAPKDDSLALLVVEMIELLFEESLPIIVESSGQSSSDDSDPERKEKRSREKEKTKPPSPPGTLNAEPSPLPAHSSSNTHYLREMLKAPPSSSSNSASASSTSRSTIASPWLYLNLLLNFAGVHRLNVSIAFVRQALRTKSRYIEVSDDGSKVRWLGPMSRVLEGRREGRRSDAEVEEDVIASVIEHNEALRLEDDDAMMKEAVSVDRNSAEVVHPDEGEGEGEGEGETASGTTREPSFRLGSNLTKDSTAATTASNTGGSGSKEASSGSRRSRVPATLTGSSSALKSNSAGTRSGSGLGKSGSIASREWSDQRSLGARGAKDEKSDGGRKKEEMQVEPVGVASTAVPASASAGPANAGPPPARMPVYVPLFDGKREYASDQSDSGEGDDEASPVEEEKKVAASVTGTMGVGTDGGRPVKRRKTAHGGLVFFKTDQFCSDLAGDMGVRDRMSNIMAEKVVEDRAAELPLTRRSSRGASVSATTSGTASREFSPLSAFSSDGEQTWDDSDFTIEFFDSLSSPSSGSGEESRKPSLQRTLVPLTLSGMSSAVASDHFTFIVRTVRRFLLPIYSSQKLSATHSIALPLSSRKPAVITIHRHHLDTERLDHVPSTKVRFPRVQLHRKDDGSDDTTDESEHSPVPAPVDEHPQLPLSIRESIQARMGGGSGLGDYGMSLNLPLHSWSPIPKRPWMEESEESED